MLARDMRWLPLASILIACTSPTDGGRLDERVETPDAAPIAPFDTCTVTTYRVPAASAGHVAPCSALDYPELPPSGGDHYGQWAAFGVYDAPVPWGFLVHSMEHGGVVLAHSCEGACPEVEAEFAAVAAEHDDPLCRGDAPNRIIIAPADLDHPVVAVAWEHVYVATCLDPPSLRAFVEAHYGDAPEDLCAQGIDLSADGWCP